MFPLPPSLLSPFQKLSNPRLTDKKDLGYLVCVQLTDERPVTGHLTSWDVSKHHRESEDKWIDIDKYAFIRWVGERKEGGQKEERPHHECAKCVWFLCIFYLFVICRNVSDCCRRWTRSEQERWWWWWNKWVTRAAGVAITTFFIPVKEEEAAIVNKSVRLINQRGKLLINYSMCVMGICRWRSMFHRGGKDNTISSHGWLVSQSV